MAFALINQITSDFLAQGVGLLILSTIVCMLVGGLLMALSVSVVAGPFVLLVKAVKSVVGEDRLNSWIDGYRRNASGSVQQAVTYFAFLLFAVSFWLIYIICMRFVASFM